MNLGHSRPRLSYAKPAPSAYRRDLPHLQLPGQTFAITFNTWKCYPLPERVRSLVLDGCVHSHGVRFELHAAVVMPDHVHLLLTPRRDDVGNTFPLSQIMNGIKGSAAHSVNRALGRRGHVWQSESFDRALRSDQSRRAAAEYICQNPVRAGLVASDGDYEWIWREWIEGAQTTD